MRKAVLSLLAAAIGFGVGAAQISGDLRNLLLNPDFDFHSFEPLRKGGKSGAFSSGYIPGWDTPAYGDATVFRESHIPEAQRPAGAVQNGVKLAPGKRISQFIILTDVRLRHRDTVSFQIALWQQSAGSVTVKLRAIKFDAEPGNWNPRDFGMQRNASYGRFARGELVCAMEKSAVSGSGKLEILKLENFTVPGKKGNSRTILPDEVNTVALEIVCINNSKEAVWLYSPSLVRGKIARPALGTLRAMPEYWRHIPRFIYKLWKGEPVHIIVMGSSIDRGSANPPLYVYDENPASPKYKQPLMDYSYFERMGKNQRPFSVAAIGYPDMEDHFAESRYFFSAYGRLKLALMRKFNLPANYILMNFMARDGSCVGEAHSLLREYAELLIPPSPGANGHRAGKSWQELYPAIFARPRGVAPDLVIFGSGANEKTDTPHELAVFEATVRYLQRHYPGVEFLCAMHQQRGANSSADSMQAVAMWYQIPFIDHGRTMDMLLSCANRYVLVPPDGHPQAGTHELWFRALEQAFMPVVPLQPGIAQLHLPERMHINTFNWEGGVIQRKIYHPKRFILDEAAFSCWASGKRGKYSTPIYVDGVIVDKVWRSTTLWDKRNSFFRFGNLRCGDRHVVEMKPESPYSFTAVDMKQPVNRSFIAANKFGSVEKFESKFGAPFGSEIFMLQPGREITVECPATLIAPAWVDYSGGGKLEVLVNGTLKAAFSTAQPYKFLDGTSGWLENRKALPAMPFASYKVTLRAVGSPVKLLGIYYYDTRL